MVVCIRARAAATEEASVEPHEDDAALVARARHDRQAFAPLYARYFEPVYRYCYRRLGTREAAEDATSLTFVKALTSLAGYRADSPFAGWLFAIAHNVVADLHRRQRPSEPIEALGDPVDTDPAPEEVALAGEARRSLRALLSALPADQRSVLELRLAGLSGAEIARALGRSHGSVKMLQLRAINKLRAALGVERCSPRADAAERAPRLEPPPQGSHTHHRGG